MVWIVGCWILYLQAVIQRTTDVSPAFLEHGSAEKIAVWAHANHDPNKQEVEFIFAWSGSELWTPIKYSRSKIKNKKPIAVDVLYDSYKSYLFITDDVIGADDTVPIQFAGNLLTSLCDVLQHMVKKILTHGSSIFTVHWTNAKIRDWRLQYGSKTTVSHGI